MDLSSPLLLLVPAGATVLGLVALVYALRGRPVDDHAICRRCGFDLFGLPPDRAVCPECGGDLAARRAVRVGHRAVRRGLAAFAALLLLPNLALIGGVTWARARGFDVTPHKPAWLLAREAFTAHPPTRDPATDELLKRLRAGGLTAERVSDLVERALTAQSDEARAWSPRWGQFVEEARADKKVGDEQWARYARQGVHSGLKVKAAPEMSRGEPLTLQVWWRNPRLGPRAVFRVEYFWQMAVDQPADPHGPFVLHTPLHGYSSVPKQHVLDTEQMRDLTEGPHELYLAVQVLELPPPNAPLRGGLPPGPRVLIQRMDVKAPFTVGPAARGTGHDQQLSRGG